jgi:hypothetical protein
LDDRSIRRADIGDHFAANIERAPIGRSRSREHHVPRVHAQSQARPNRFVEAR